MRRHANTEIVEWSSNGGPPARREYSAPKQAEVAEPEAQAPEPAHREREARRPRHTKPRRPPDSPRAKLIVGAGRRQGIEPADVVGAVVDNTRLDGEDVGPTVVLERFSFVEVPAERAEEVIEKLSGKRVRGIELRLEVARR